ncbi:MULTISPECIES: DUF2125 domain-containing protein [Paracoccus]|uniref:DUF2125 domain-containing protein n=1 Tax=Paracoccus TaxID=265 RepID=UPI001FB85A92|nr:MULTISPECIES: DUF2125 domain-containing protein [Paracoccus]MCJ1900731.1 DUF2125 domain-containing protein [Paracoccus versutus]MDF3903861.1 DUF2125 domain-containing protein [Paracoccus sp. AS002]WGR60838.1 DUF2125 domain-containing protein [Paracoccus ferrooxidans]
MNLRLTSSALALAAMAAPALADVTSEQVWQSWVDYYQSLGYTVTEGNRDKAGDTLTLSDVVINGGMPESQVDFSVARITLSESGDGTVRTVFADQMTGEAHGTDPDGQGYSVPFTLDIPGNVIVTSGAPEDMTHEFDYPTMDFALTTIKSGDKETPLPIKVGVADSTGTFHIVAGSPAKYDYAMKSGRITFSGDVTSEEDDKVKFEGSIDGAETSGEMAVPDGTKIEEDMNAALKAGLAMDGVLKAGAMAVSFDFAGTDEDGQETSGAGKYDGKGFELSFGLSQDGMTYQAGSDAGSFELTSSDMPFPINYAIESGSFDMQMPVMQSDQAQPFKFAYSLAGLTLGDAIWNLFDAQGQLPRDPASLDIDVTGQMKVTKDIFDPASMAPASDEAEAEADGTADGAEGMEAAEADPQPFEPVEVAINQFALNALGAKVNAEGALKAPESGDMTTPVGEVHARYEGVNGLIDKLGAMGLIPEDQIMGVRMMMAMFAKPVAEGEDKLETRLEFKEDGSIFANGQQIK